MSEKKILANLNLSNNLITNLAPPINQLDGVNKDFIDENFIDNFNIATYLLSNSTTTPPNTNEIRLNNATLDLSTEVYIHITDSNGFDISTIVDNLTINNSFIIRQVSDSTKWIMFNIGTIVDNTSYYTISVTHIKSSTGGNPLTNEICKIEFSANIESNIYTTDGTLEGDRKVIMHGASASNTFSFRDSTDTNDLFKVQGDGNVGIGTTTPSARLDIKAQGALSTDNVLRVRNSGDTNDLFKVQGDGNVGIGTSTPTSKLDVVGEITTTKVNKTVYASNPTGTVIGFTEPEVYNSATTPATGNITDDLTNSKIGVVQKIYHNHTTAPTLPAGWVLMGSNTYVTGVLNIIYCEWSEGTRVEYWIVQQN